MRRGRWQEDGCLACGDDHSPWEQRRRERSPPCATNHAARRRGAKDRRGGSASAPRALPLSGDRRPARGSSRAKRVRQGAWAVGNCGMGVGKQRCLERETESERGRHLDTRFASLRGDTRGHTSAATHLVHRSTLRAALTVDPTVPSSVSSSRWAASGERRTGARAVVDAGQGGRRRQRFMTVTTAWRGWPWIALW